MRLNILVLLTLFSFALHANADSDRLENSKPNKTVALDLSKNSDKSSIKIVEPVVEKEESGKTTYEQFCVVCHRDGLIGAPKFGDEADWKPRLSKKTFDDLIISVNKGLNAMPAKGTCTECSDEDLKNAIQYMLPKS